MRKSLLILVLLLSLVFILTLGCNGGGGGGDGAGPDDRMEITVALWEVDPTFVDGCELYAMIQERFNVDIVPIPLTWDDYHEKVNTWVATNDMPDVFNIDLLPGNAALLQNWIREEMVRPMPEDMSAYPNLAEIFTLADVEATRIDGQFWNIPRARADKTQYTWVGSRIIYYRRDWAEQLGFDTPQNIDEVVAFLRAVMEHDPSGTGNPVGITAWSEGFLRDAIWHAFEPRAFGSWQYENGNVYRAFDAPNSFEAASFMREMYNEGLIDPDIIIQSSDAGGEKFMSNRAAMFAFQVSGNFLDNFDTLSGTTSAEAIGILPLLPNIHDGNTYFFNTTSYWSEMYISADVSDAKFDRILQLADFFASEEWFDTVLFGIEGVDWRRNGSDIEFLGDGGTRVDVAGLYSFLHGFQFFTVWTESVDMWPFTLNDPHIAEIGVAFYHSVSNNPNSMPTPQSFLFDMISTPLRQDFVDDSSAALQRFIYGRSDGDARAEWDEMIASFNEAGLQEMIAEVAQEARNMGVID